ncbi:MAG: endolytic transglycosylase MltG [Anaerolineae bacterium]|nr:endolytic transglycosylase MltG [Anaerolineae bacterium]
MMNRDRRSRHLQASSKPKNSVLGLLGKLTILVTTIGLLVIAGGMLLRILSQHGDPTAIQFKLDVNPALNPTEATLLRAYLAANQDALNTPIRNDETTVTFIVNPGESAGQIADSLVSLDIINDATLFRNYMRYYGLDTRIEAGSYQIAYNMTIPQLAVTLTEADAPEITIRITEGWRREQIADWLNQQSNIPFNGAEFLSATGVGAPIPPATTLITEIPPGATLEGFLFPDTYRMGTNDTATDFVQKMLINFDSQVTSQMRADAAAEGMRLHDVLIIASIVEREAIVAEERPTIAGVYLNRLHAGVKLDADPTVQYAMGYQADSGQWWNLSLTIDHYQSVDSPYNTYLYTGLPPGPIANPGIDSIKAVIYPEETAYFFFRAACDGSGRHNFARTYEEHLQNACQ